MTLRQCLSQIQRYVLEPEANGGRSWRLGLWDREEILGYLYAVEQDFIRRTPVVRGWALQPYAPNQPDVALDPEVQEILHADVDQAGRTTPAAIVGRHEADQVYRHWARETGRPRAVLVDDAGTSTVTLVPIPAQAGQLHLLVVPLPQRHGDDDDPLTVGALWAPFVLAGVLGRMFGKPGPAYNAARRDRCQAFYELGITLATQVAAPLG